MRTRDRQKVLAHLSQPRKIVAFTLYGYLTVTTTASPMRRKLSAGVTELYYEVCAIAGGPMKGDEENMKPLKVEVESQWMTCSHESQDYMLSTARAFAKWYVNEGRGVRGRGYAHDIFNIWISEKKGFKAVQRWRWYERAKSKFLSDRKGALLSLKKRGYIGNVNDRFEALLGL